MDAKHDQELGGGKKEVTYYKGGVELPNFLLLHPSKEFPEAVRMNGIHQLALRELSMASLGTANSLGLSEYPILDPSLSVGGPRNLKPIYCISRRKIL